MNLTAPCANISTLLIFHPVAWTSCPVISMFSYTSRNSCPVSVNVFKMTERRRWVSHSGSNPRRQTTWTQGYKNWFHGMTNISIPEVNMFKHSSTFVVCVPINLSIKLGFVSVNGLRETYFVNVHYASDIWLTRTESPIFLNFVKLKFPYVIKKWQRHTTHYTEILEKTASKFGKIFAAFHIPCFVPQFRRFVVTERL